MQREFVKNVITLMTGTALGQGLALLLSPILTRIYSPEDFSVFEQYAFLLSVLTVVVTGKYEFAIMHPKSKEDARNIAGLAMRFAFVACGLLLLIFTFTSEYIAEYAHSEILGQWLWTLPFTLLTIAIFNVVHFWFSREKNYKVAATSKLLYSAAGEPIKIASGIFQASPVGLIIGTISGHVIAAWYSWKQFVKSESKGLSGLNKARMTELAHEHRDYPRFAIWGGVLNNLAQWAHVAVFTYFYGEKALIPIGLIALSRRIFFNPLGILSSSYGQVFYQRISEIESPFELRSFYLKNLGRFLLFASVLVIIVQLLPTNTLGILFGEKWTDALVYLKILCYWYSLNFVIGTLSFIFYRLKLQAYTLLVDAFHFIAILAAFAWSWYHGYDELGAVKIMVWTKVIYLILNGALVIHFLNRNCSRTNSELT